MLSSAFFREQKNSSTFQSLFKWLRKFSLPTIHIRRNLSSKRTIFNNNHRPIIFQALFYFPKISISISNQNTNSPTSIRIASSPSNPLNQINFKRHNRVSPHLIALFPNNKVMRVSRC